MDGIKYFFLLSIALAMFSVFIHLIDFEYIILMVNTSAINVLGTFKNIFSNSNTVISENPKKKKSLKIFSKEELKQYNGELNSKGLCIAIMGKVFNVKKGKQHYGPGGGYHFFAGVDGSRAFVSGDFTEEGLIDDVSGLSTQDYIGLSDWVSFYEKDYKFVGYVVGRFYDENGNPTEYKKLTDEWIEEARQKKDEENVEKKIFPPCNSEWSHDSGGRVWCTNKSGGVEREWIGVPRKLKVPGKGSSRCACVRPFGPPSHDPSRTNHDDRGDLDHPNLQEYKGCKPDQPTCRNI